MGYQVLEIWTGGVQSLGISSGHDNANHVFSDSSCVGS